MSRRIDIELTSALGDGTWTWRAAGARQPRGTLDGAILPTGAKVGDEFKVEVEQELDGISVLSVVTGREKHDPDLLTLLPVEREFQPVIETRAGRERGERPRRSDGDRRPRRDDAGGDNRRGDKPDRDRRPERDRDRSKTDRPARERAGDGGRPPRSREARDGGRPPRERRGPSFTPPPEVPQRPKPKRLRPGKAYRTAVLAELPPEQRPIAELALQGMGAVRTRLHEENERAVAEGRAVMPEASVMKMAEELLPTLRVAEWRDRAEAAKVQAAELDLRDLRSVVAASGDPMVARDETTRALADELKQLLATKQEQELQFWYGDIDAALAVGRVIRALRLSSQPPKAGVPFPSDIAQRLADSTNASLTPMDAPDRWAAMLEAAAFSPIRSLVRPARKPDAVTDELLATVTRLAPALPHLAELFEIEVPAKATMPKPLRPNPRPSKGKEQATDRPKRGDKPPKSPKQQTKPEPKSESPAAADARVDSEAEANTEDKVKDKVKADGNTEDKVKDKVEADANTEDKVKDKVEADANTEDKVKDKVEADANTEDKVKDKVEADANTEDKVEDKVEADANTEDKVEDKVEADANTEDKVEDKVEADAKVETETQPDPDQTGLSDNAVAEDAPAEEAVVPEPAAQPVNETDPAAAS